MKKKFIALLGVILCVVVFVSTLVACSEDEVDDVIEIKPETTIEVKTADDLISAGQYVGVEYSRYTIKLMNDIDLTGKQWKPIGLTLNKAFMGVFDGNNKEITGLKITGWDEDGNPEYIAKRILGWVDNTPIYSSSEILAVNEGEAYAETYSNYKARKDLFGVIENSVIVGSNIAKDENGNEINYAKPAIDDFWEVNITTRDGQKKVRAQVIFLFIKGTHNYILEDDLKGMTDLYQIFKDLGFDDVNTWGISYSDIGCVPNIINVYNLGEFAFDNLIEDTEDAVDESEEAEQQIAA